MKVKETRKVGFGGSVIQFRVRTLAAGEEMPANAVQVPEETPESDWAAE